MLRSFSVVHLVSQPFVTAFLRAFGLRTFDVGRRRRASPEQSEGRRGVVLVYTSLVSYFTYILECADKSLYVGSTNNIERRLEEHNESKWGAHYTKIRRPVVLKYVESFPTLKESRQREAEIKGWRREKKLGLIQRGTLDT